MDIISFTHGMIWKELLDTNVDAARGKLLDEDE